MISRTGFRSYVSGTHRDGQGNIIAVSVSIQQPNPPKCVSPSCLFKFMMDCLFCALLSSYHTRRVTYAEANRHKKILERYRTGEPSPKNIWQAIHAILKLKCPICNKFDRDPLLFSNIYKEKMNNASNR